MEKVMDRVVETQFKIYNAICYRVWKLCFLGNRQPSLQVSIRVSGWQSVVSRSQTAIFSFILGREK